MPFLNSRLPQTLLLSLIFAGCSSVGPKPQTAAPVTKPAEPVPGAAKAPFSVSQNPAEIFRRDTYDRVPGWYQDDLREAWPAFLASCKTLSKKPDWNELCLIAQQVNSADAKAIRLFFETFLVPNQVFNADGTDQGLVTGYYEPLLHGSRKRSGAFQTPLYRAPDDLVTVELGSIYAELKRDRKSVV